VAYLPASRPASGTDMDEVARSWTPERVFEPRMSTGPARRAVPGVAAAVRAACLRPGRGAESRRARSARDG
jgi:hypothetical protein